MSSLHQLIVTLYPLTTNSTVAHKVHAMARNIKGPATNRPRRTYNQLVETVNNEEQIENDTSTNNLNESYTVDEEDEKTPSAFRWQASEESSSFLYTIRKSLSSFERKTIRRKYPHPDVNSVYTPSLEDYLTSLVQGAKGVDKQNKFLRDWPLDTRPTAANFLNIRLDFCSNIG